MRQVLAPFLFDDEDKPAGEARRASVVAPAQRSPRAQRKAQTKRTEDGEPVHSCHTLLQDLGTLTKHRVRFVPSPMETTELLTTPPPFQQRVFELLQVPCTL